MEYRAEEESKGEFQIDHAPHWKGMEWMRLRGRMKVDIWNVHVDT